MAFKYTRSCYESMEWQLWWCKTIIKLRYKPNKKPKKKPNWPWLIVASLEPSFFSCTFQGKFLFSSLSSQTTTFFSIVDNRSTKVRPQMCDFLADTKNQRQLKRKLFSWSRIKEGFYRLLSKELWKIIVRELEKVKRVTKERPREAETISEVMRKWRAALFFWITHSFEVN